MESLNLLRDTLKKNSEKLATLQGITPKEAEKSFYLEAEKIANPLDVNPKDWYILLYNISYNKVYQAKH